MNKINDLFKKELKVINMGIEGFSESLKDQKVEVIQMDWKPAAGGNKKMAALLQKLK